MGLKKIPISMITKQGPVTESFYDYLVSRYIAPFFTLFIKGIGVKNPNIVTLLSFLLILLSSFLVMRMNYLTNFYYRLLIALVIQFSFILDCSDGQLARILGRSSKIGAWMDRILDRVGEFLVFTCFGFAAYFLYGKKYFIALGMLTGYMLAAFTLAMSLGDSLLLENFKRVKAFIKKGDNPESSSSSFKDLLSKIFFFLNFGIGERYLYLSFFILINNIGLMLYITSFLSLTRTIGIVVHVRGKLKEYDKRLRVENDSN